MCITAENIKKILDNDFCKKCYDSNKDISYEMTYPALLKAGEQCRKDLTIVNIKILALATYGWMPTILDNMGYCNQKGDPLSSENIENIENFENQVIKAVEEITSDNPPKTPPEILKKFMNNSYVGLSKFLHFLRPDLYAIWDSNVYCALKFANINLPKSKNLKLLNNALGNIHDANGAREYNDLIEHIRTKYCIAASEVNKPSKFNAYESAIRSCEYLKDPVNDNKKLRSIETRLFCVGKWLSGLAKKLNSAATKHRDDYNGEDSNNRYNKYRIFYEKIRELQ